jgi:nitrite reductase/ring-hydroxylating ferredoxin subunit
VVKKDDAFPLAASAERALDRRRFLGMAACGLVVAAAGEWCAARGDAAPAAPLELELADASGLAPGEARAVEAAGGEALVVRLASGEVVAFDRRCPHLGCPVVWSAERDCFECPCHHAAFEARTGRVLHGPPRRGLVPAMVREA